jgi:purine-binding chemotaxis protein CheW
LEQNPVNLDATWSGVSRGVYRLDNRLLVIMDIDQMLAGAGQGSAAAAA